MRLRNKRKFLICMCAKNIFQHGQLFCKKMRLTGKENFLKEIKVFIQ